MIIFHNKTDVLVTTLPPTTTTRRPITITTQRPTTTTQRPTTTTSQWATTSRPPLPEGNYTLEFD